MVRYRLAGVLGGGLCLMFILAAASAADPPAKMVEGEIVSAGDGKIDVTDGEGERQSFETTPTAKILLDGEPCRLEDLKPAMPVVVWLNASGAAEKVLATFKNTPSSPSEDM